MGFIKVHRSIMKDKTMFINIDLIKSIEETIIGNPNDEIYGSYIDFVGNAEYKGITVIESPNEILDAIYKCKKEV